MPIAFCPKRFDRKFFFWSLILNLGAGRLGQGLGLSAGLAGLQVSMSESSASS